MKKLSKEEFKARAKISLKRKSNWWISFPLVIIGGLQANLGFLNNILTPNQFGMLAFTVGLASFAIGWSNSRPGDERREEEDVSADR